MECVGWKGANATCLVPDTLHPNYKPPLNDRQHQLPLPVGYGFPMKNIRKKTILCFAWI